MTETPNNEIVAGAVIMDGNRVLLVQQRKPSAFGKWGYPGGHVEADETVEDTVRREVLEETGLQVTNLEPLRVDKKAPNFEHHAFLTEADGEIKIPSGEILGVGWFSIDDLDRMKPQLRAEFIYDVAKTALEA